MPDTTTRPSLLRDAWPYALPFAVFIALMMVEPLLEPLVEPMLDPRWLYAIRSGIVALLLLALWSRYPELNGGAAATSPLAWVASVCIGGVVFVIWILLDSPPFVVGGSSSGYDPRVDGAVHWGFAATRILGSALVVPVMEELFWRSFLLRWLHHPDFARVDPRATTWKAVAISSVVFATEHSLLVAGFLAGLAYGELYRRTGDLRLAILAHAVTNAVLGAWVLHDGAWTLW